MADRAITSIAVEYTELGQNLRATWSYISDLLKMWITFEIGSTVLVLFCTHLNNAGSFNEGEAQKFFIATILFSILSVVLSAGAGMQNSRLVGSASAFVKRAAFLETLNKLGTKNADGRTDIELPPSQYIFMEKELRYSGAKTDLVGKLSLMYYTVSAMWVLFIVIYSLASFTVIDLNSG